MAWILWNSSLVMGFGSLIMGIIAGDSFNPGAVMPMAYPVEFAVAGFYAILTVAFMILRDKDGTKCSRPFSIS